MQSSALCRSRRELSNAQFKLFSCKIWLRYSRERALQSLADRRDPKFFVARRSCHLSLRRPRPGTPRWSRLWRSYGSISPCLGGKSTGTSFTNLYISTKSRSLCNFQISDTSAWEILFAWENRSLCDCQTSYAHERSMTAWCSNIWSESDRTF